MNDILAQVLGYIHLIKDDKQKLQKVLNFILEEIHEEKEEEPLKVPERFEKVLSPIAQSIDAGFICYLNPETMEIEELPNLLINDPHEYEMITGFSLEDEELKHESWKQCYVIEPPGSGESFKIMEAFAEYVEDVKFREQLVYVLSRRKPFANFKWKVENSRYRKDWFDFKQKYLEKFVRQILWDEINRLPGDYSEKMAQ